MAPSADVVVFLDSLANTPLTFAHSLNDDSKANSGCAASTRKINEIFGMQNVIQVYSDSNQFPELYPFVARDTLTIPNLRMLVASICELYNCIESHLQLDPKQISNEVNVVCDLENIMMSKLKNSRYTDLFVELNSFGDKRGSRWHLNTRGIEKVRQLVSSVDSRYETAKRLIFVTKNKALLAHPFTQTLCNFVERKHEIIIIHTSIGQQIPDGTIQPQNQSPFGQNIKRDGSEIGCASLSVLQPEDTLDGSMSQTFNHDNCSHDDFVMVVCALLFPTGNAFILTEDSALDYFFNIFQQRKGSLILNYNLRTSKESSQWLMHASLAVRLRYAPSNAYVQGFEILQGQQIQNLRANISKSPLYLKKDMGNLSQNQRLFPWETCLIMYNFVLKDEDVSARYSTDQSLLQTVLSIFDDMRSNPSQMSEEDWRFLWIKYFVDHRGFSDSRHRRLSDRTELIGEDNLNKLNLDQQQLQELLKLLEKCLIRFNQEEERGARELKMLMNSYFQKPRKLMPLSNTMRASPIENKKKIKKKIKKKNIDLTKRLLSFSRGLRL